MASPDPAAGNLGTLTRQILDDSHFLVDQDRIWRKICDVIRFHYDNRLWFSERPFSFALTAGRNAYAPGDGFGLPVDLVQIVGKRVFLRYRGQENQSEPLWWLSNEEWDLRRESWETAGTPDAWTFDGRRFKLVPTPDNSADVVTGNYVTNIGVPRFKWNGTAYDFYTPEGATLTGEWGNDWLQTEFAEAMIRNRVMYELMKTLRDPESETYLGAWLESKSKLEEETDSRVASGMDRLVARLL